MEKYRNSEKASFIWNGQYSDPQIEYEGVRFNYYFIEGALQEECIDAIYGNCFEDIDPEKFEKLDFETQQEIVDSLITAEVAEDYLEDVLCSWVECLQLELDDHPEFKQQAQNLYKAHEEIDRYGVSWPDDIQYLIDDSEIPVETDEVKIILWLLTHDIHYEYQFKDSRLYKELKRYNVRF